MTYTVISWANHDRRGEILAQHLGCTLHRIHYGQSGRLLQAPFRYAVQTVRTWRLLRCEKPDVIVTANPPIFAALAVYIYARLAGARFAIDSHTGAFVSKRWRWSLGLHRYLSRRAAATIVHNTAQEAIVQQWDCPYCVIGFTPGDYSGKADYPLPAGFNVAVISTYKHDEPVAIIFEAARQLPDVCFHFTGSTRNLSNTLREQCPPNCHLCEFLPYDAYIGLLSGADVVLDLTTRDETLLLGGFEAVSIGTPLITSDWPLLQAYFHSGTIHVPNTVDGIRDGVRRAQRDHAHLRDGIVQLRRELTAEWQTQFGELQRLLTSQTFDVAESAYP